MTNVLMIEDDLELAEILTEYLEQFDITITIADDPYLGLSTLDTKKFDLVILDLTLPGLDGLEVCKEIRKRHSVPIIISSARTDITDKVKHLEISAVVDNAIPVDLTLSVEPRNEAGEIISGITLPESVKIEAAPNGNGTIQSTAVKITIKEERDKALQELDKLSIKIEGVNSDGNNDVTLRPDQFIVVRMSAKLPDGAQMDLDDL